LKYVEKHDILFTMISKCVLTKGNFNMPISDLTEAFSSILIFIIIYKLVEITIVLAIAFFVIRIAVKSAVKNVYKYNQEEDIKDIVFNQRTIIKQNKEMIMLLKENKIHHKNEDDIAI